MSPKGARIYGSYNGNGCNEIDDDDENNGNLYNFYYVGLCLNLADKVSLDASARIFNGSETVSMDSIWNTEFSITASMKF